MTAYYNENDSFNVEWLKHLMAAGVIAPGEIDGRDIREVRAEDLRGFTQCHFFAGIGVWSYALRLAGWPDEKRVWTGSCPCQPFSVSGKRAGASDERHLWPEFFRLISIKKPVTVFGEQVASDDGLAWLDLVSSDLEGQGYTVGAVDTPACGFGAPHRRQRLYWVADAGLPEHAERRNSEESRQLGRGGARSESASCGNNGSMADSERDGRRADLAGRRPEGRETNGRDCTADLLADSPSRLPSDRGLQRSGQHGLLAESRGTEQLADASGRRREQCDESERLLQLADQNGDMGHAELYGFHAERQSGRAQDERRMRQPQGSSSLNGFWRSANWLWCRDQKYRPVEPGTFPLAHGIANRVGKLRGYGNALVAPQAEAFVRAYMEVSGMGRS